MLTVGYGRIGSAVSKYLLGEGYELTVLDSSVEKLREASRIGVETIRLNVLREDWSKELSKKFDLICTCLPGSISFKVLKRLASQGLKVVDVSYFPEDYRELDVIAKKNNSLIVIDAGVAPGLSNILAGRIYSELKNLEKLEIYVGGLPENPKDKLLGITITWNPQDLIEEYIRPARIVENGIIKEVDPLSRTGKVLIPKIGAFEYFVSDGLRTLLYTLRNVKYMAEYTLRYHGHVEYMKTLRSLGLMSKDNVEIGGCKFKPIELLTLLFNANLSRGDKDITVLYVKGSNNESSKEYLLLDKYSVEEEMTSMSRTTGYTMGSIAATILEGKVEGKQGVLPPEAFGIDLELYKQVIVKLSKKNIIIEGV